MQMQPLIIINSGPRFNNGTRSSIGYEFFTGFNTAGIPEFAVPTVFTFEERDRKSISPILYFNSQDAHRAIEIMKDYMYKNIEPKKRGLYFIIPLSVLVDTLYLWT